MLAGSWSADAVAQDGSPQTVEDAPPHPPVITQPAWSRLPRINYPAAAGQAGIRSGQVTLDCAIMPDRTLTGCSVIEETPPGVGFGTEALRGIGSAVLTPSTVDGVSPGTRVRPVLRFQVD